MIAYVGATVLNPMHKWQWFNLRWCTPILAAALTRGKANLRQLWESSYTEAYTARPPTPQNADPGEVNDFVAFLVRTTAETAERIAIIDELDDYLREPVLLLRNHRQANEFRALAWWIEPTQQARYLKLCKMAFDLLTMPAMSAEIERLFSECSLALSTQRLSISQETLELLMCLRLWRRQEKKVTYK